MTLEKSLSYYNMPGKKKSNESPPPNKGIAPGPPHGKWVKYQKRLVFLNFRYIISGPVKERPF
jgi:hypothetical protein